jgi:hypothetical protein
MKRNVLEIYALAVCFFNVACFVIVLGMAVWNVVSIAVPQFTMNNYQWQQFQSDSTYSKQLAMGQSCNKDYVAPTGRDLTDARVNALNEALASQRHGDISSLIHNIIILLINVLVFFAHWKLAARARQSAG